MLASILRRAMRGSVTARANRAATSNTDKIRASAHPPSLPMLRASPSPAATPTIKLDTTSGITATRIALTNTVPIGSRMAGIRTSHSEWLEETAKPRSRPATRLIATRSVRDINWHPVVVHLTPCLALHATLRETASHTCGPYGGLHVGFWEVGIHPDVKSATRRKLDPDSSHEGHRFRPVRHGDF